MILGRNLVGSMARESSKDTLDSTKRIHELIDSIELKKVSFSKQRGNEKQKEKKKKRTKIYFQRWLNKFCIFQLDIENSWSEMEKNLDTARVIGDLEKGVSRVTDWILGPADAMLNSCCQVGFDVSSSEELRRRHEELELECRVKSIYKR